MKKQYPPCELCGLPVKVSGFTLAGPTRLKKFCCEGCLRIFQLLAPELTSTKPTPEKTS